VQSVLPYSVSFSHAPLALQARCATTKGYVASRRRYTMIYHMASTLRVETIVLEPLVPSDAPNSWKSVVCVIVNWDCE
jgi:hypothetical protein